MNAAGGGLQGLADAAFLSSGAPSGGHFSNGYTDAEMQAFGTMPALRHPAGSGQQQADWSHAMQGGSRSLVPAAAAAVGRHLQILDHTVHRIDNHTKANGEEEKEMVVSNLRHFNLKIGVLDPRMGVSDLPLKAELLYENGQLVEQLATCEPLLVGKTEVVAMQGTALFKLRITSLSSHRDKQRFRIRVSPIDQSLLLHEPNLHVVTTPMKCVTKLSHRSSSSSASAKVDEGEGEGEAGGEGWGEEGVGTKRKRDDVEQLLAAQGQQLAQLQKTNGEILEQLKALKDLIAARGAP